MVAKQKRVKLAANAPRPQVIQKSALLVLMFTKTPQIYPRFLLIDFDKPVEKREVRIASFLPKKQLIALTEKSVDMIWILKAFCRYLFLHIFAFPPGWPYF